MVGALNYSLPAHLLRFGEDARHPVSHAGAKDQSVRARAGPVNMAACVEATVELFWSSAERLFAYLERRGTLPTLSYVFYVS